MTSEDREIRNASDTIDQALLRMTAENRGETSRNILNVVRNLNDNIAEKVWKDLNPNNPISINKVASQFVNVRKYRFIGLFDKFLRKSVSHFTPNEDGAEILILKYFKYILMLKQLMKLNYGVDIINNADKFLDDTDKQTQEYYSQIASKIDAVPSNKSDDGFDAFYINKIKPFYINNRIYYEVTLEPAEELSNKFNRITAFTKYDILPNYAVSLKFTERKINAFNGILPIAIIQDWKISIRPCEFNNFARIFHYNSSISKDLNEYKSFMQILKENYMTLIDVIDLNDKEYTAIKNQIIETTRNKTSRIFDILDICRDMSINSKPCSNIIRYLLLHMNNKWIKSQRPTDISTLTNGLFLSAKCLAFDNKPFFFHPVKHRSNIYDLLDCLNPEGRDPEFLARRIENNTEQRGVLYTPIAELSQFGDRENIEQLISQHNNTLYYKFKPNAELEIYNDHVFKKEYETKLHSIIDWLVYLVCDNSNVQSLFTEEKINALKLLNNPKEKLDDPIKANELNKMFKQSRVHFIYGAAGTGKSTLINHIAKLMEGKKKIFLAKTNPAVENLKRKVVSKETNDECITIDRFIKANRYKTCDYDLIVVDECSTVENQDILKILELLGNGILVLAGDIYQIQSIGFGNWFNFSKSIMPDCCQSELTTPFRSTDSNLLEFWNEVRNIQTNNVVMEKLVKNEYFHPIDEHIFDKQSDDEIVLCLNYNGLYGINNINKIMQLHNPKPAVYLGIWQFKTGDPILFNDSERFGVLYNNLKGTIKEIAEFELYINFKIEVDIYLDAEAVAACPGLTFIDNTNDTTVVSFKVNKRAPYASDKDEYYSEDILPFQLAYAVSIHKSQGLEYDSVKIIIADDTEDQITHSIFYTAITRAKKRLTIYWSPEVCNRIIQKLKIEKNNTDYLLIKQKLNTIKNA